MATVSTMSVGMSSSMLGEPMELKNVVVLPEKPEEPFLVKTNYVSQQTGKIVTSKTVYSASAKAVQDRFRKYFERQPIENLPVLLPRNCCYYESTPEYQKFLIEVQPGMFTVKYNSSIDALLLGKIRHGETVSGATIKEVELAMPWQYFWAVFKAVPENEFGVTHILENSWLLWSQLRISSLSDNVFPALLPNIYHNDGKICLGDTFPASNIPVQARAESIVSDFYEGIFNTDLNIALPPLYKTLKEWATDSKRDKFCWMAWNPHTLSRLNR